MHNLRNVFLYTVYIQSFPNQTWELPISCERWVEDGLQWLSTPPWATLSTWWCLLALPMPPALFQALVNDFLCDVLNRFIFAYLNSILIFSQNMEEYIRHVRQVLQWLLESKMSPLWASWASSLSRCRLSLILPRFKQWWSGHTHNQQTTPALPEFHCPWIAYAHSSATTSAHGVSGLSSSTIHTYIGTTGCGSLPSTPSAGSRSGIATTPRCPPTDLGKKDVSPLLISLSRLNLISWHLDLLFRLKLRKWLTTLLLCLNCLPPSLKTNFTFHVSLF